MGTRAHNGESVLGRAVAGGYNLLVERLLAAGADIDGPGREEQTPLMIAARSGRVRSVALLLKQGADVNAVDAKNGNTALMLAANRGLIDIVELLLAADANTNIRAKDGWTALAAAEMIGDTEIADVIRRASTKSGAE